MFTLLGLTIPLMLIINFAVSNASRELLASLVGDNGADMLRLYLVMVFFFFFQIHNFDHPANLFYFFLIHSPQCVNFGISFPKNLILLPCWCSLACHWCCSDWHVGQLVWSQRFRVAKNDAWPIIVNSFRLPLKPKRKLCIRITCNKVWLNMIFEFHPRYCYRQSPTPSSLSTVFIDLLRPVPFKTCLRTNARLAWCTILFLVTPL